MSESLGPDGSNTGRGGLSRTLMRSHLRVALIGAAVIVIGLVTTIYMRNVARQMIEEGQPRHAAISECRIGVQKALASLRGWVSIEDPQLRNQRRAAWDEQIYPALDHLDVLYENSSSEEANALAGIRTALLDLEEWQWYVEDVAHAPGNRPVQHVFDERMDPVFVEMFRRIGVVIEIEASVEASHGRKQLLKDMADFRGKMTHGHDSFRQYVQTFNPVFRTQARHSCSEAQHALEAVLNQVERLELDQQEQLRLLEGEVKSYSRYTDQILVMADGGIREVAEQRLESECLPRARAINEQLDLIAQREDARMTEHAVAVKAISTGVPPAFGLLLLAMMGTAYLTARRGSNAVTERVSTLVDASRKLAEGELNSEILDEGDDEISLLARSFDRMRVSLHDREQELREKEEESRLIIDTATDAVIIINSQGLIQRINLTAENMFGYTPEEILGKNVSMLMPSPHAEQHDGYLSRYLETGEAHIIGVGREVEGRHKNGQLFSGHLAIAEIEIAGERMFSGIITDLTEVLAVQHDLDAEKERFNLAVQGSSDGIWDWDVVSNEVYFSPRFKGLLGYQDHEFQNQFSEFESRLHPDDHERTLAAIQHHLETREPYDVEYRLKKKNGEYHWFQARGQAIWDEKNTPVRMAGSLTDISERKTVQAELEQFNLRLEKQNRLQARLVALNDAMRGERHLQTLADLVLKHMVNQSDALLGALYVVNDDEPDQFDRLSTHAIDTTRHALASVRKGEGLVGQVAMDGKTIQLSELPEDYFYIQSGTGSRPPSYAVMVPLQHDEQIIAVLEFAAFSSFSDEDLEFIEQASEPIAIGLRGAQLNQRMETLLGHTREQAEILKEQQEEMKSTNEELQAQAEALQESQQTLQDQQEELQVMNEELEEQKESLEVKNSLVEQANLSLGKSAEELAEASRYKSEFLANMSHELRTPLNSMLILSRMLENNKSGNLAEKEVKFAQTIHKSGNDLLTLINDILDLSKVEAGKLEADWGPCSLDALTEKMHRQFDPVAGEKGIVFDTKKEPSIPDEFTTDHQRLEQILRNLASNAFKFTSKGSVSLEISRPTAEEVSGLRKLKGAGDGMLAFRLRDTGIGIPLDKQQTIFESFQQADGGTSRQYGGTGLGLSISREFAMLLGGEIQVESQPGEGSCFKLFLPEEPTTLSAESPPDEATTPVPAIPEARPHLDERPPAEAPERDGIDDDVATLIPGDTSILIVEDDVNYANVLGELAREKGFKRLIATDGITGLHYAFKYRPHAVLLDATLPELDGPSVLARLKANPDTRDIPVHFVTGREDLGDFKERGAVGLLKKPVSTTDLLQAFDTISAHPPQGVKKVLVVDGDAAHRQDIVDLVGETEQEGVEVVQAETAAEAQELLTESRFDCMILDFALEGKQNAIDLLEHIRDQEQYSHPPVIIHSQDLLSTEEEERLRDYADSIVIKGARSAERLLDEATLFLHEVRTRLTEKQKSSLRRLQGQQSGLGDKVVLLVDDDLRNAYALSAALEEQGMQIVIKKNGREALDGLDEHPEIDMVLMDIMMPIMDGYQAMREIRKQKRFKNLPIIALTAKAMKDDRERCISAGANDYLPKPVDIDRLISLIHVWIQQGVRK